MSHQPPEYQPPQSDDCAGYYAPQQRQQGPTRYQPDPYDGYHRQRDDGYGPPKTYAPAHHAPAARPRKRRRVFMWIFFAIQVIFIIWIIAGIATKNPSVASQVASFCDHGGWSPLYKSQADCLSSYGRTLNDATDTGKGLGVAFIVILWVILDFFLGLGYGIYRLATRSR